MNTYALWKTQQEKEPQNKRKNVILSALQFFADENPYHNFEHSPAPSLCFWMGPGVRPYFLYSKEKDRSFYQTFSEEEIWQTHLPNLTWSHYNALLRVDDKKARGWYMSEAVREAWSVKTLERNISTQYYYRLLMSQVKEPVVAEMREKTSDYQADKLEFSKNPIIAEFLGLAQNTAFTETKLESAILTHLQKFLMELGKGYAFVARQQHIRTELDDYFIDICSFHNARPIRKAMLTWWAFTNDRQGLLSLENVYEIEHIYARNRQDKEKSLSNPGNLNALGNKALLEKRINIRASDYRFVDKKKYYNGFTNSRGPKEGTKIQELVDLAVSADDFTESDIIARTERIMSCFVVFLENNGLTTNK